MSLEAQSEVGIDPFANQCVEPELLYTPGPEEVIESSAGDPSAVIARRPEADAAIPRDSAGDRHAPTESVGARDDNVDFYQTADNKKLTTIEKMGIGAGGAVVVAGLIFAPQVTIPLLLLAAASCGGTQPEKPDRPLPYPGGDSQSDEEEEVKPEETQTPPPMEPEQPPICEPELCDDGVIDYERVEGDPSTLLRAACLSFTEVSATQGLVSSIPHSGIAIVDYDMDGAQDIYVLNDGAPNQMFRRTAEGYVAISSETGLNIGGDSRNAAWADYDSDGDLDLFLVGSTGSYLYRRDGALFVLLQSPLGINDQNPGKKAVWMSGGFYLGTENGTRFYQYEGDHQFTEAATSVGLDDPGDATAMAITDYNGDGADDVYVANVTGTNRFFRNQGDGTFESVESETSTQGNGCSTDTTWVRTASDLLPSLYVADFCGGNQFFANQGDGTFLEQAASLGVRDPGQTTAVAAGDFLNEGKPALFLGRWNQENLLYVPDAASTGYWEAATPTGMAINSQTLDARWFDHDNDGDLDLLVVMADGSIELHQNNSRRVRICPMEE